jgi:hypothetical protein
MGLPRGCGSKQRTFEVQDHLFVCSFAEIVTRRDYLTCMYVPIGIWRRVAGLRIPVEGRDTRSNTLARRVV